MIGESEYNFHMSTYIYTWSYTVAPSGGSFLPSSENKSIDISEEMELDIPTHECVLAEKVPVDDGFNQKEVDLDKGSFTTTQNQVNLDEGSFTTNHKENFLDKGPSTTIKVDKGPSIPKVDSQDLNDISTIVYCCTSKCLKAPDEWKSEDIPCNTCQANGFCHCGCVSYPGEKEPGLEYLENYVFHVFFCCPLECFTSMLCYDIVDGMACKKCKSYGICRCKCQTYMRRLLDQHCCPNLCINLNRLERWKELDIGLIQHCLLCVGWYCRCLCVTFQKELLGQNNLSTVRINKKEMVCVTDSHRNRYCCSQECFKVPRTLLYGLACPSCKCVNYCQCGCLTFQLKKMKL